jgi:hypothetical protein
MASLLNVIFAFLGLLVVAVVLTMLILQYTRPSLVVSLTPKQGDLSKPTTVGTIEQVRSLFLTSASSSFTVYMYCNALDKTPKVNNTKPTVLFKFGESIQFVLHPPGASTLSNAQLLIKTQGRYKTEIIDVPSFPTQKWVYFGLVREGRRFTVYYNGVAVTSHRTEYFPVVSTSSLVIGDEKANGRFMNPNLVGVALTSSDMKKFIDISADTREKPYEENSGILSIFSPLSFGCPDGLFCFSTSGPPRSNPLVSWKSSYA